MAWCPICKNEYRKGFKVCSECNVELVDELDPTEENRVSLCCFDTKELAEKFTDFLDYSRFEYYYKYDETDDVYLIECEKNDYRTGEAKIKGFLNMEKSLTFQKNIDSSYYIFENENTSRAYQDAEDGYDAKKAQAALLEQARELDDTHVYQSKRFKADETYSSGLTFLWFGIAGLAFMVLNIVGMLNILNIGFSSIIMCLMFVGMIVGGVISIKSSKRLKNDADEEDSFVVALTEWTEKNITKEKVLSADDPNESEEFNVLFRIDYIKKSISDVYPGLGESFLNYFSENFYYDNFESEGKED